MIKMLDSSAVLDFKPMNYRQVCGETVEALKKSIIEVGVQVPLEIWEKEGSSEKFIISGHHRVEALKEILKCNSNLSLKIPVLVNKAKELDFESNIKRVVSNSLRNSGSVFDKAEGFAQLREQGMTVLQIANACGVSESYVKKSFQAHKLPEEMKSELAGKTFTQVVKYAAEWQRNPSKVDVESFFGKKVNKGESRGDAKGKESKVKEGTRKLSWGEVRLALSKAKVEKGVIEEVKELLNI